MKVSRKYGLLRFIATLLKILGVLALALGLLGMVLVLAGGSANTLSELGMPAWLTALGALALPLVGLIWFVQLFAFGSILSLLISIEENTRALTLPAE